MSLKNALNAKQSKRCAFLALLFLKSSDKLYLNDNLWQTQLAYPAREAGLTPSFPHLSWGEGQSLLMFIAISIHQSIFAQSQRVPELNRNR